MDISARLPFVTLRYMSHPRRALSGFLALGALLLVVFNSCKPNGPEEIIVDDGGYPTDINRIMMLHCTTGATGGGCHNALGAENAAGLRLDSWDRLFDGTNHGAAVIPFDTVNSPLLHFINTDTLLGSVAKPTMPLGGSPLSREEYLAIRNWIAQGAPDKNGVLPFSENAGSRQKVYLTNQASDMMSVIDAGRRVVMRNIPLGVSNSIESPHCVRVSKDGQFAYVSFLAGDYIQKIDTRTDKVVAQVQISNGGSQWNVLHVSDDGARLIVSDITRGWVRLINTATMQVTGAMGDDQLPTSRFIKPHGIDALPKFDTIYMTGQYGNTVFKFTPDFRFLKFVSIDGAANQYNAGTLDPHEIMLTPDGSKYFLTCEASNEVRIMDAHTDALLAVIPMPSGGSISGKPQELAVSNTKPYMFVTCMEAVSTIAGTKGAVVVINYETMQVVKTIYGPFWQPHGITVDDQGGKFYIASTNIGGPFTGHNHTNSSGSVGWYNIYDLITLEPVNTRQYEVLSQPYSADSRNK